MNSYKRSPVKGRRKIALGKLVADYLASKKKNISSDFKALKKETVESCSRAS